MKKVVINVKFGGFGLSHEAYLWLIAHGVKATPYKKQERDPDTGLWIPLDDDSEPIIYYTPMGSQTELDRACTRLTGSDYHCHWYNDNREDPLLVQCVEELGSRADGRCAQLKIVEIPDDVEYFVEEYDGNEHISEKHRMWS